ncbi:MAG: hypothetical protein ACFFED_11220, partial [Candidatus Thorarchaeota archaeon]
MKAKVYIGVVMILLFVSLGSPVCAAQPPPGGRNPPVFTSVSIEWDYTDGDGAPRWSGALVQASCKVTWDPNAVQRYVWLYVDNTRYTMSYDISTKLFYKTLTVTSTSHTLYLKAREMFDFETALDAQTSNYYMTP